MRLQVEKNKRKCPRRHGTLKEQEKRDKRSIKMKASLPNVGLKRKDSELRPHDRRVLLIGRVKEYRRRPHGGFVTIDVIMPEQVQTEPSSPSAARPAFSANLSPTSRLKVPSPTLSPASAPSNLAPASSSFCRHSIDF
jgi:hypothetical protein